MTNEEFMAMYNAKSLAHGWVTSKEAAKRAEQIKRQKEYNAQYYRTHSEKRGVKNAVMQNKIDMYVSQGMSREDASKKVAQEASRASIVDRETRKAAQKDALFPESKEMLSRETAIYMNSHPNVSKEDAESAAKQIIFKRWFGDRFEQMDLDTRNQKMARTAQNQGAQQKASELARRGAVNQNIEKREKELARQKQEDTLRRSGTNTALSDAQTRASKLNRSRTVTRNRNVALSKAQADAARKRNMSKQIERTNRKINAQSQARTNAYAKDRQRQRDYNNSLEGRIDRVLSRTFKKTSDTKKKITNAYNDSVSFVNDILNTAKKKKDRAKKNVKKYFG